MLCYWSAYSSPISMASPSPSGQSISYKQDSFVKHVGTTLHQHLNSSNPCSLLEHMIIATIYPLSNSHRDNFLSGSIDYIYMILKERGTEKKDSHRC